MKPLLLFFVSALLAANSFSQEEDPRVPVLNNQLGVFQVHFQRLMAGKGHIDYNVGKLDFVKIKSFLQNYELNAEMNAALLFYHHSNDTLYSWIIKNGTIKANDFAVVRSEELLNLEVGLKSSIRVDFSQPLLAQRGGQTLFSDSIPGQFFDHSQAISRILFPPGITGALKKVKYLTIVPVLNISTLPLYALQPFNDGKFLIDKMSISIAHSLDELMNKGYYFYNLNLNATVMPELEWIPSDPVIVGNPDFSNCPGFMTLAGAEREAELVAAKFKVLQLTGKKATKTEVLLRARTSEFIYLATHGVADVEDPMHKGSIVLAGNDSGCVYWTADEIQFNSLSPQAIVVLSACQTGLGKVLDAGIIGVGRSFMKAHAGNVIMSLWSVGDQSTKDLMDIFTDELFVPQHFFPAENLRQAILKYKAKNPDPADWAAFINMGTPYPPGMEVQMGLK